MSKGTVNRDRLEAANRGIRQLRQQLTELVTWHAPLYVNCPCGFPEIRSLTGQEACIC